MIDFHVTFGAEEEARRVAQAALEVRLAACVNIVNNVRSLYWWHGTIEEESEVLAIFKTSKTKADALATFIAEKHPYDTPAIIRHDGLTANAAFARWVEEETTAK